MKIKKVNVGAVAKLAGVSAMTVTRGFNSPERVAPDTLNRIRAAAEKLGYVPSAAPQILRTGRSRIIGLLCGSLHNEIRQTEMIHLAAELSRFDYRLFSSSPQLKILDEEVRRLVRRGCDGLIVTGFGHREFIDIINRYPLPAVVLSGVPQVEIPGHTIRYNHENGIEEALAHLAGLGHWSIYHFSHYWNGCEIDPRRQCFIRHFGEGKTRLFPRAEDIDEKNLRRFFSACPDCSAILCSNDLVALRLIQIGVRIGIRIPEMLSVVGFDDIAAAAYANPALTTIRQPIKEVAAAAAQLITHLLDGAPKPEQLTFPSHLCLRQTTSKTIKQGEPAI